MVLKTYRFVDYLTGLFVNNFETSRGLKGDWLLINISTFVINCRSMICQRKSEIYGS